VFLVKWILRNGAPTLSSPAGVFGPRLGLGQWFWNSGLRILFRNEGQGLIGVGSGRCSHEREQGVGVKCLGVCVSGCSF
jgi:hypothetical protein